MKVIFDRSFYKCLDRGLPKQIAKQVIEVIEKLEHAPGVHALPNIKKLAGFKNYYRIRIGQYRLGLELEDKQTVRLIMICHRKEIYRKFPERK